MLFVACCLRYWLFFSSGRRPWVSWLTSRLVYTYTVRQISGQLCCCFFQSQTPSTFCCSARAFLNGGLLQPMAIDRASGGRRPDGRRQTADGSWAPVSRLSHLANWDMRTEDAVSCVFSRLSDHGGHSTEYRIRAARVSVSACAQQMASEWHHVGNPGGYSVSRTPCLSLSARNRPTRPCSRVSPSAVCQ